MANVNLQFNSFDSRYISTDDLVTSVGLEMPAAFTVTNSPLIQNGSIQVNWGSGLIPNNNLASNDPSNTSFLNGSRQWSVPNFVTSISSTANNISVSQGGIPPSVVLALNPVTSTISSVKPNGSFNLTLDGTISLNPFPSAPLLGGVKQGSGFSIDASGTTNLLAPTATVNGGVRAGSNVSIDANGVISSTGSITSIVVGAGLSATVSGGVVTISVADPSSPTFNDNANGAAGTFFFGTPYGPGAPGNVTGATFSPNPPNSGFTTVSGNGGLALVTYTCVLGNPGCTYGIWTR